MSHYRAPRATLSDVVNRLLIRFAGLHHKNVRTLPADLFGRGRSLMLWISNRAGMDAYNLHQCSHELCALANTLDFVNYQETVDVLEVIMRRVDEEAGRYRPRPAQVVETPRTYLSDYTIPSDKRPFLRERAYS